VGCPLGDGKSVGVAERFPWPVGWSQIGYPEKEVFFGKFDPLVETFLECETMCREPPPGHVFVGTLAEIDPRKVAEVVRGSRHIRSLQYSAIRSDIGSPIIKHLCSIFILSETAVLRLATQIKLFITFIVYASICDKSSYRFFVLQQIAFCPSRPIVAFPPVMINVCDYMKW